MSYDIHLDAFEGPLDLLLHLIKKDDLEISEIKIAEITSQYLSYLDMMKDLNIDIAGEFLVMASTLMQIKAKTLLPSGQDKDGAQDDPFDQLKNRLLEYQKYKEIGKLLSYKAVENSQIYYRPAPVVDKSDFVLDVSLFDLMDSFRQALTALPDDIKEIMYQEIPIEVKIREILDVLEGRQYVSFTEILKMQKTKTALIVCFMAVLELIKNRQIAAKQSDLFGEIRVYRVYNEIQPEEKSEDGVLDLAAEDENKGGAEESAAAADLELEPEREDNDGNI
ncbi:MAG: segregation/condensation protein A [Endomicrobium sp.]|jgi:segregation and condensation protein A|nr:segregation/condensation protein A [Endomicrobium sp.]